jgi:hypothetical protein
MPMIDAHASAGTFADQHKLAVDLASRSRLSRFRRLGARPR